MDFDEIKSFGRKYESYYAGRVSRDLCVKLKKLPVFELGIDSEAWTGPVKNGNEIIHIGLGLLGKFPDGAQVCEKESDFHSAMRFLTGHEGGHQKYTTDRSFTAAVRNGYYGLVEYAVKAVTGRQMRLIKGSDFDAALDGLGKKYGVYVSRKAAKEMVHFLINAIEDGRMERCNMIEKPGFKDDVVLFRGRSWMHTPICDIPDLTDPREHLCCVLNQILSLATMGVWQKGFLQYIAGTETESFIRSLKPEIDLAVTSRSCAKGMEHAGKVMVKLYPFLFEACKLNGIEQLLGEIFSGLRILVPDMDPEGKNPHSFSTTEKEDVAREEGGADGQQANIFSPQGKTAGADEAEKSGIPNSLFENQEPGPENICPEQIAAAIAEAEVSAEMATASAIAVTAAVEAATGTVHVVEDNSLAADVVGKARIKDICSNFHEYMHSYKLDNDLPQFIQQGCGIIRRQYEQYFRSRKRPVRRNQKSGKIDTHQLSRLVRGDLDVYLSLAKDGSFSGCIEIFLDNSGSMAGLKKQSACSTLARIEEYLKGLIPLKICAFDYSSGNVNVEIIKNWNEVQKKNCSWNFYKNGMDGGGTPTEQVLRIAMLEMLKRPEKHKMIMLLTDENTSDDCLEAAIKDIRRKGIQLSAVYFDTNINQYQKDSFYKLFDNRDAVACEPAEIGIKLLPVIKRFTGQR